MSKAISMMPVEMCMRRMCMLCCAKVSMGFQING